MSKALEEGSHDCPAQVVVQRLGAETLPIEWNESRDQWCPLTASLLLHLSAASIAVSIAASTTVVPLAPPLAASIPASTGLILMLVLGQAVAQLALGEVALICGGAAGGML